MRPPDAGRGAPRGAPTGRSTVTNGDRNSTDAASERHAQVPKSLWSAPVSHPAFRVLVALLGFRNARTSQCNPKQAAVAQAVGMSEMTVRRHVAELREAHLVTITRPNRAGSNHYAFPALDEIARCAERARASARLTPRERQRMADSGVSPDD